MAAASPLRLDVPSPFDLVATLESGQAHRWRREGEWYYGVVCGNLLKVRQSGLCVEVYSAPEKPERLVGFCNQYFRLDDDLHVIYREINRDTRIASMIDRYSGLRLLSQEPWECLVAFICSATSNIRRIAANMEAIAQALGSPVKLHDHLRFTFPSALEMNQAGETVLRKLGLGFRAKYLALAAEMVSEGEIDLEELQQKPYWEAKGRLMDIPGVGPKIADCVLAFSLNKLEAFPIDRWVGRALHEWYLGDEKLTYEQTVRWAHGYFGPYAGYAQQYLFHGRRLDGSRTNTRTP